MYSFIPILLSLNSRFNLRFLLILCYIQMCRLAVADSDWLDVCSWDALTRGYRSTPKVYI